MNSLIIDDCVDGAPWEKLLKIPANKRTKEQQQQLEFYHVFMHGRHSAIFGFSNMRCPDDCPFRTPTTKHED